MNIRKISKRKSKKCIFDKKSKRCRLSKRVGRKSKKKSNNKKGYKPILLVKHYEDNILSRKLDSFFEHNTKYIDLNKIKVTQKKQTITSQNSISDVFQHEFYYNNKQFHFIKTIARGGFGTVDLYETYDSQYKLAIKRFFKLNDMEITILQELAGKDFCNIINARLYESTYDPEYKIVFMNYFPLTLSKLAKKLIDKEKNSMCTNFFLLNIFYRTTQMLKCLYSANYSYMDIKGINIMCGYFNNQTEIALADLGSLKKLDSTRGFITTFKPPEANWINNIEKAEVFNLANVWIETALPNLRRSNNFYYSTEEIQVAYKEYEFLFNLPINTNNDTISSLHNKMMSSNPNNRPSFNKIIDNLNYAYISYKLHKFQLQIHTLNSLEKTEKFINYYRIFNNRYYTQHPKKIITIGEVLLKHIYQEVEYENLPKNINIDFSNLNLSSINLKNMKFYNINLENSIFTEAKLWGINLIGANLKGADFYEAKLQGANLTKANLTKADLTKADLKGAIFGETNLEDAILIKTELVKTYLKKAILIKANLTKANLEGAKLIETNLTKANLEGAKLIETNLTKAKLQKANLEGANLEGANLEGANLEGANLEGANLEGTILEKYINFSTESDTIVLGNYLTTSHIE